MTRLWPAGEPLAVWGEGEVSLDGPGDLPAGFAWRGVHHHIADVHNRWCIHTCWWLTDGEGGHGSIWREYVKVTTGSGLLCLLYHDLLGGGWFLARVYD